MTTFSIRDAAREAGVSKTSILRAIQSGRMSAPRKEGGGYAIEPSELFRAFPPKSGSEEQGQGDDTGTRPVGQTVPSPEDALLSTRTAALEAEVRALKELVRRLDLDKQDIRDERDKWQAQAERLALAPPSAAPSVPASSGWWPFRKRA